MIATLSSERGVRGFALAARRAASFLPTQWTRVRTVGHPPRQTTSRRPSRDQTTGAVAHGYGGGGGRHTDFIARAVAEDGVAPTGAVRCAHRGAAAVFPCLAAHLATPNNQLLRVPDL